MRTFPFPFQSSSARCDQVRRSADYVSNLRRAPEFLRTRTPVNDLDDAIPF
jgi:hypothetical protein